MWHERCVLCHLWHTYGRSHLCHGGEQRWNHAILCTGSMCLCFSLGFTICQSLWCTCRSIWRCGDGKIRTGTCGQNFNSRCSLCTPKCGILPVITYLTPFVCQIFKKYIFAHCSFRTYDYWSHDDSRNQCL